ncbi:von Willebrand factor C domain-containing protein 2-like [Babylonia areolata]|uniref:von Willebrand factor C domain-containing protein 2-like n=1 Tax=Babylonia areolata TaxID=304850 RepID=UPI003FD1FF84
MKAAVLFSAICLFFAVVESSTIPLATKPSGCMYQGKWYPEGEFKPDPCSPCHCFEGRAVCAIVDCFFPAPCVDAVRDPDQCCPVCPNGPNCRAPDGQVITAGQHVQINEDTTCSCPQNHGGFGSFNAALCLTKVHPVTAQVVN